MGQMEIDALIVRKGAVGQMKATVNEEEQTSISHCRLELIPRISYFSSKKVGLVRRLEGDVTGATQGQCWLSHKKVHKASSD